MTQPRIVPRKMEFDFDPERTPRHWFGGNPYLTHFANGMHLLFPEGERFFIRSVRRYADRVTDPALKARLHSFFAQEAQHGKQHALSFEMLQAQGYDVTSFLEAYEQRAFPLIEKVLPPIMCLSVTVALEHLTATLGANALTDPFIERAAPEMRALLQWHAAEAIEHKSVAFDVLAEVDDGYLVRVTGMLLALGGLLLFSRRAARMLLAQEPLTREQLRPYAREAAERQSYFRNLMRGALRAYFRPGFHPDQNDDYHLAEAYLASIGRLAA